MFDWHRDSYNRLVFDSPKFNVDYYRAGKTGSGVERLHDCRARNVLEAIMWHGCKNEGGTSDAYHTVVKFRNLTKKEREQLINFIESI